MPGGRPPSYNPARTNPRVGVVTLPAEGRPGDAPPWPLPGRPLKAELDAWTSLWSSPQAVAWESLGWNRVVARYTRVLVESERRHAEPSARTEARQLEDRLGLTPKAMRLLLWVVAEDEVGSKRDERDQATAAEAEEKPARRLAAVDTSGV